MDLGLAGKTAFISGSTKGIGRAIAVAMLREGARVIVNGRSDTGALVRELAKHGEVRAVEGDLSKGEDVQRVCAEVDAICGELGGELDILVNNMGIFSPQPFAEIDDEAWQTFFDANVMSTVRLSRHYFPKMLKRAFGRIINISSEAGVRGLESMIHYSTTKGAQLVIARGLANLTREAEGDVTVNSVLPGPTSTEGVRTWLEESAEDQGQSKEEFVAAFFRETEPTSLLQRFIQPEEIASIVTFLASPRSAAINGASIRAEGGLVQSIT